VSMMDKIMRNRNADAFKIIVGAGERSIKYIVNLFAKIELKILYIKNLPNNFQVYQNKLSLPTLTEMTRGLMPVAYNKLVSELDFKFDIIPEQSVDNDIQLKCFT